MHAAFDISWSIMYPLGVRFLPGFLLSDTKSGEDYIRFPTRCSCWEINFSGPCSWSFGVNIPLHQTLTFHRVAALLTKATAHPCLFTRFLACKKLSQRSLYRMMVMFSNFFAWHCGLGNASVTSISERIWKDYLCMVTLNNWTKSTVESITRLTRCIVFTWQQCKQWQGSSALKVPESN